MNLGPQVSVIIPCFNLGAFLEEAVDSVLAQTVQDFEILIVDDGSTDAETSALLRQLSRPKTTVFRTPNRGLAAARNFLISRASGDFLCALDADDVLAPTYFERALAAFGEDPGLCFVSSWLEAFGDESWVWRQDRCDLQALLAEDTVTTAALVRRQAVIDISGYDEAMPHPGDEDWDLWLRLVAAGHRGLILPEVLFRYRRRTGSMSRECVEGRTHLELVRYMLNKHEALFRKHRSEVLLLKEREVGGYLRDNDALELRLTDRQAILERRRSWLAGLEVRLRGGGTPGPAEIAIGGEPNAGDFEPVNVAQNEEYDRIRAEVEALRSSWSWRVTGPLRWLAKLIGFTGARR